MMLSCRLASVVLLLGAIEASAIEGEGPAKAARAGAPVVVAMALSGAGMPGALGAALSAAAMGGLLGLAPAAVPQAPGVAAGFTAVQAASVDAATLKSPSAGVAQKAAPAALSGVGQEVAQKTNTLAPWVETVGQPGEAQDAARETGRSMQDILEGVPGDGASDLVFAPAVLPDEAYGRVALPHLGALHGRARDAAKAQWGALGQVAFAQVTASLPARRGDEIKFLVQPEQALESAKLALQRADASGFYLGRAQMTLGYEALGGDAGLWYRFRGEEGTEVAVNARTQRALIVSAVSLAPRPMRAEDVLAPVGIGAAALLYDQALKAVASGALGAPLAAGYAYAVSILGPTALSLLLVLAARWGLPKGAPTTGLRRLAEFLGVCGFFGAALFALAMSSGVIFFKWLGPLQWWWPPLRVFGLP